MFKTLILVCALDVANIDNCYIVEDEYGPYSTRAECVLRAKEMQRELSYYISEPVKSYHKCEASI